VKKDPALTTAILLTHYGFELNGDSLPLVIEQWLDIYPNKWVLAAVVEALYQGRYKVSSVNRILNTWCSKGEAVPNFDHDFADFFCKKIIRTLLAQVETANEKAFLPESKSQLSEVNPTEQVSEPFKFEAIKVERHLPNPGIAQCARLVSQL